MHEQIMAQHPTASAKLHSIYFGPDLLILWEPLKTNNLQRSSLHAYMGAMRKEDLVNPRLKLPWTKLTGA